MLFTKNYNMKGEKDMKGEIDYKKVLSFFAAMSGGGKETMKALRELKGSLKITHSEMENILKNAGRGFEKIAKEIKDTSTKHWIYLEVMFAAYRDQKISRAERRYLNKIKEVLEIDSKRAKEIEMWVKKFLHLTQKGNEVIFGK